jgi:2-polyprenyl-3-methyl-5-hydroxy-6-metoxy-1,4-benzoquinol methylase
VTTMSRTLTGAECPVCGGTVASTRPRASAMVRTAFAGSQVVRCAACDLSYLFPRPTSFDGVYEEDYFRAYEKMGMTFPTEGEIRPRYIQRLNQLRSITGGGTLLEIGVGHGAFLQSARQQGWKVLGVDISHYAAEYVQNTHGISVHRGTLAEASLPAESIDAVHMSHVLEHVPQPVEMMLAIKSLLRPGGVLAIEVPNELETLLVRIREGVGAARAYSVQSTHLQFFSPKTLVHTATRSGYVIRSCRTERDLADGSAIRRGAKVIANLVERPLDMAPLIELLAQKPSV